MALINQQAVEAGNAPLGGIGFIDATLSQIGTGSTTEQTSTTFSRAIMTPITRRFGSAPLRVTISLRDGARRLAKR